MSQISAMYKTIDLCAGIGGVRRGFELTGRFENVLSAEIDKYACKTYEHLFGDNPMNDLTTDEFLEKCKAVDFDVLCAGFPCQAFSSAGLELGFKDQVKGTIFFSIENIIEETRPKAIMLENVENLIRHDKGRTFEVIIHGLEEDLNYGVVGVTRNDEGDLIYDGRAFVRNSRHFGIPQNRPRTYIMAFDRTRYGDSLGALLPKALPASRDEVIFRDLNDLLEMGADARYYLSSGLLQTLKNHRVRQKSKGNGFGCKVVNAEGVKNPCANTIMATGGSGKERNLVVDVQDGIAGMEYPSKRTPLNDENIRFMTPREWGKLQGFIGYGFMDDGVDTFSFPEGMSVAQQYKQFGNSVTIPVIRSMAEVLCITLDSLEDAIASR